MLSFFALAIFRFEGCAVVGTEVGPDIEALTAFWTRSIGHRGVQNIGEGWGRAGSDLGDELLTVKGTHCEHRVELTPTAGALRSFGFTEHMGWGRRRGRLDEPDLRHRCGRGECGLGIAQAGTSELDAAFRFDAHPLWPRGGESLSMFPPQVEHEGEAEHPKEQRERNHNPQ